MTKKTNSHIEQLERVFHEPSRLSILTTLLMHDGKYSFANLKTACSLTDGNLKSHLKSLEAEKIVKCVRQFPKTGRPLTTVSITASGRKRFTAYLKHLQEVVDAAHQLDQELRTKSKSIKTKLA